MKLVLKSLVIRSWNACGSQGCRMGTQPPGCSSCQKPQQLQKASHSELSPHSWVSLMQAGFSSLPWESGTGSSFSTNDVIPYFFTTSHCFWWIALQKQEDGDLWSHRFRVWALGLVHHREPGRAWSIYEWGQNISACWSSWSLIRKQK